MRALHLLFLALASLASAQNAQNATSFALTYGYPLLSFQKLANLFISSNNTNKLVNIRTLSNGGETIVVKPNHDTIYSVTTVFTSKARSFAIIPEKSAYLLLFASSSI